jgi:protocatechuate 3,4-dioxygenase beta subunit
VEFRATPVGLVVGRIVDTSGRPIGGIAVELFRRTYGQDGADSFGSGGATTTNPRGEYQLSAMPHAGYLLFARMSSTASGADPAQRYAGSLYPGTTEVTPRRRLTVRARSSVMLKDLVLEPQRLFAIRGRVVDGASGRPPSDASVWITTTSLLGAETITAMPTYNRRTGPSRRASAWDGTPSA